MELGRIKWSRQIAIARCHLAQAIGNDMLRRAPPYRSGHTNAFAGNYNAMPPEGRDIEGVALIQTGGKPVKVSACKYIKDGRIIVIILIEKYFAKHLVMRIVDLQKPDLLGANDLTHQGLVKGMVMPSRARILEYKKSEWRISKSQFPLSKKREAAYIGRHLGRTGIAPNGCNLFATQAVD